MTDQRYRIAGKGRIDPGVPLRFRFDGKHYVGCQGDTLASALLANGVHLVGRSFKYHRPRGIVGAWADEPNGLVGIRRDAARYTPNLPATQVELFDGLEAVSQNRYPSLISDWMAPISRLLARFIPAGFYYKSFMWPRRAWKWLYEPTIRAAAGLGVAPDRPDPDRYANRYAHCDVLVIGAGPAGLAAALSAAETGARVILCDERTTMGGSLKGCEAVIDGLPADAWVTSILERLDALPGVTRLSRTNAFGYYPHNMIGLAQRLADHLPMGQAHGCRERLWQVRAREVVIAAGAIERPLVFTDNDRPGIMLASAASTYLREFGVIVGSRVAIVTAHDSAYRVAQELHAVGVTIAAIADLRATVPPIAEELRAAGIPLLTNAAVTGTSGGLRISAVSFQADGKQHRIYCDALLMSGGFTPNVQLFSQARGTLAWSEKLQAFVPDRPVEAVRCAGACQGSLELDAAIRSGMSAGTAAAVQAGFPGNDTLSPDCSVPVPMGQGGMLGLVPGSTPLKQAKAFVDWQNDVTAADLQLAVREGFVSIEHIKRYTTIGMATDQGKLSNLNGMAIVAELTGRSIPGIGLTTFRAPYSPVTFGTLAGPARGTAFEPTRHTAMHDLAVGRGAVFEPVGQWLRARYFPLDGEDMAAAVARECWSVRNCVGMFDASTLGKIEVVGPDAAEFLNRMYVNSWNGLAAGRCRYGILLGENGFVLDDGVIGRIAQDRFHVTTTTGGAARVLGLMEDYLQTEWPELDVWLTSTTEQWAVITVQGPLARKVLEPLVEGLDISAAAFPHMSVADARICGVPMRLMRVSFTGELGFEVNIPAGHASMVWKAIEAQGQADGMVPYGTEAMHVLRAEKGFIIVGQETDGTVAPDDLGLSWAIGKSKADFVGRRSLGLEEFRRTDRKQLAGLLTAKPDIVLEEGAQIVALGEPDKAIGHVTSAYYSAALGRSIALALVSRGRGRKGETLGVPMPGGMVSVEVADPVFFDPEGVRVHA